MWIKNLRLIWVKVKITNPKFRLSLPISFYVFEEILDSTNDLMTFLCMFLPRRKSNTKLSIARQTVQITHAMFQGVKEEEPFDLVDVTTEQATVTISFK